MIVVGPLSGKSKQGIEFIDRLAQHCLSFPRAIQGLRLTLLRDPNPDARVSGKAGNERGVLLDRNFETARWHKSHDGKRWLSGKTPNSEPETAVLTNLLADSKPDRLIVLATAKKPSVAHAGPAEPMTRAIGEKIPLATSRVDPRVAAGSLAAYAGYEKKIPTIVYTLPEKGDSERVWDRFHQGLLAALDADAHAERSDPAPKSDRESRAVAEGEHGDLAGPLVPVFHDPSDRKRVSGSRANQDRADSGKRKKVVRSKEIDPAPENDAEKRGAPLADPNPPERTPLVEVAGPAVIVEADEPEKRLSEEEESRDLPQRPIPLPAEKD